MSQNMTSKNGNGCMRARRPVTRASRLTVMGLALGLAAMASPGLAQDSGSTGGVYLAGAERIDLGDRLRYLSQRITVNACLIDAGSNVEAHQATLRDAIAEFDHLLSALKDGDAGLGVTRAEDQRKMLAGIRGVLVQWEPFKVEAETRLGKGTPAPGPDFVSRQNLNLMHVSKNLISTTINHYTIPPALLQNDAQTIQFAARQRTLSQQIAKEACGILTGNTVMGRQSRLDNAVERFEASFDALQNGMPAVGISAPTSPEVKAEIASLRGEWSGLRSEIEAIAPGGGADRAEAIYTDLDKLLAGIDAVIPYYVEESKSGL